MNIYSPKILDSSFDVSTSDEELEESCKHPNNHILSDDMKVDEEDADRVLTLVNLQHQAWMLKFGMRLNQKRKYSR